MWARISRRARSSCFSSTGLGSEQREELRRRLAGGLRGEPGCCSELDPVRFWKDWTEAEMESERVEGREAHTGEDGLMEWIRVLNEDFEDLRFCLVAKDMNSSAEECREERSLFSITLSPL